MDLYLMRHPAREGEPGLCLGQTDVPLSQEGRASLPRLGAKVSSLPITRVLSSDLQRCLHLAQEIAQKHQLIVESHPVWRELHFGDWENRPWDEIRQKEGPFLQRWMENFVELAPPGGETFRQLQTRVFVALQALEDKPSDRLVLVTHAGVIRALVSTFSPLPLAQAMALPVPYGSLLHLIRREGTWQIAADSEVTVSPLQEVAG